MTRPPAVLDSRGFAATLERAGTPLAVDFWAPWCGPCRSTMPVFEEVASEMAARCAFGTVNVDDHPELARQYDVRSIPTILVFSGGKVVARAAGAQSREQLLKLVSAAL